MNIDGADAYRLVCDADPEPVEPLGHTFQIVGVVGANAELKEPTVGTVDDA